MTTRLLFVFSVAVVLMVAAGTARAQDTTSGTRVYKCVDAVGGVSYQGMACATGGTRIATRAAVLPVEAERRRELDRSTAMRAYNAAYDRAYTTYSGQHASARDLQRTRCADAKAHREAALAEVGLGRSFELLRSLDDTVYEACKGL